ncbi:tyrosine-type recombinase/integrase [Spirillospora sp. NBC_01491]|uniref:tyrosine-type recombinase/integrase n=1 Tax=Spirillospora sp. NBC_01491 TaxID=2976007 RepID=UPI002E37F035|nr:tyrosine-type recombinase/integrase [Spirillospora sp. NBC_01491]
MAKGTTFKSCGCRDAETGRLLRAKCPRLRRGDGRWSSNHGSWYYQLELPSTMTGTRRNPLRRGGFPTQDAAEGELDRARELLAIAGDDSLTRNQIAELIISTVRATKRLPVPEEIRGKTRTGQDLDASITVGRYLETWLAGRRALREGTRRSYESHIRLYLVPHIGTVPLDRLRVADVESVFEAIDELNETIEAARRSGDPVLRGRVKGRRVVGAATRQRIRATLRAALGKAIKERRIDVNVAALVELPSGKAPRPLVWTQERIAEWRRSHQAHVEEKEVRKRRLCEVEPQRRHGTRLNRLDAYIGAPRPSPVMVWTPDLTRAFLQRAESHRLFAQYYLVAFRGLRRGESCGLRWPDVDLDQGVVTVRWQITQLGAETREGKPKSEAGEGQVTLDKSTIKVLRAHRARQNTERLAAGESWTETGFVFTTETGQPLHPAYVTEQFEQLSMEADLPPIRFHDLRHGAASILLAAGYDMKVVQETLRLSSITIAADTYTSLLPGLARQSAEDAAAVILNAGSGKHGRSRSSVTELATAQDDPTGTGPAGSRPESDRRAGLEGRTA